MSGSTQEYSSQMILWINAFERMNQVTFAKNGIHAYPLHESKMDQTIVWVGEMNLIRRKK